MEGLREAQIVGDIGHWVPGLGNKGGDIADSNHLEGGRLRKGETGFRGQIPLPSVFMRSTPGPALDGYLLDHRPLLKLIEHHCGNPVPF